MHVLLGLLGLMALAGGNAARKSADIAGVWRGTSLCVRPAASAACHDETVVYRFTIDPANESIVHQKAFKIVNGSEDLMGEQDFHWDAAEALWIAEFSNPRYHGLWRLRAEGRAMKGELVLLPDRQRVRDVSVTKD